MTPARRRLAAVLLLALAACGPRPPPAALPAAPAAVPAAAPQADAAVRPPAFGDRDPHPWPGRTPASYPVHGIDLSRWQGAVDWAAARDAGVSFAWIKATEGGDLVDPAFRDHWRAARRAGVPAGAYHFWYHCRPGAEQARWFLRHLPRSPGALPPVLDVEWTPRSPTCRIRPEGARLRAELRAFLDTVEAATGQRPVLYVTPDVWADADLGRIGGTEFWLRSVADHPSARYPGQAWTFWQYSSTGTVPGIATATDLNAFAGSAADWARWRAARSR